MSSADPVLVAQGKSINGRMVSEKIDFSYLGVHGLWNQDIGICYILFSKTYAYRFRSN